MTDRFTSDRRPVPVVSEGPAITSGLSREGSSNETRASDFGGLWQLNSIAPHRLAARRLLTRAAVATRPPLMSASVAGSGVAWGAKS